MPARQIAADLWQLTLPTPFAVGDVHAYVLLGDSLTLFDAGLYTASNIRALDEALDETGILSSDLAQIIVSHGHIDHFGQAKRLHNASHAAVLAHENAVAKIADLDSYARRAIDWARGFAAETGLPAELFPQIERFYAAIPRMAESVWAETILREGDIIAAGSSEWHVIFCPGHSGDLICLYDPKRQWLLGSDHLLAHVSSNALVEPPMPGLERRRPLIDYWRSLERLCDLEIELVLPGHGEVVTDHRALISERRQRRVRRLGSITDCLQGDAQTVWEIVRSLFPRLGEADIFLGLSEVVGHLDILQEQGRVYVLADDLPLRYAIT
ncbi:MAG: MBL fold metallo-hydrolase [Caldilineales bacterium]|nr:MBL fold metallo-hydrolase [Caldilineales bacterium]